MLCKFFLKMFLAGNFICQLSPLPILPRHLPAFLPNLFPQPFRLYHCDGIAEAHRPGKHHLFLLRAEFQKNRAILVLSDQLIFVPFALKDVVRHFCVNAFRHNNLQTSRRNFTKNRTFALFFFIIKRKNDMECRREKEEQRTL